MIERVGLCRDRQPVLEYDLARVAVLHLQKRHPFGFAKHHRNDAPGGLRDLRDRLDRVVDHVAEQRIGVGGAQKVQDLAVRYALEADVLLLADEALFGEDHVQHLVARTHGHVVEGDGALQLVEFLSREAVFEREELVLDVVELDAEHLKFLAREVVLLFFEIMQVLAHAVFLLDPARADHVRDDIENEETAQDVKTGVDDVIVGRHLGRILEEHGKEDERDGQKIGLPLADVFLFELAKERAEQKEGGDVERDDHRHIDEGTRRGVHLAVDEKAQELA